jgi:hypothetical protein
MRDLFSRIRCAIKLLWIGLNFKESYQIIETNSKIMAAVLQRLRSEHEGSDSYDYFNIIRDIEFKKVKRDNYPDKAVYDFIDMECRFQKQYIEYTSKFTAMARGMIRG